MTITNVSGQVVMAERMTKQLPVNVSDWAPGLYYYSVVGQEGSTSGSFIVE